MRITLYTISWIIQKHYLLNYIYKDIEKYFYRKELEDTLIIFLLLPLLLIR